LKKCWICRRAVARAADMQKEGGLEQGDLVIYDL